MEQRIANLFKEDQRLWGWSVEPNCAFPDDETGKSREIDLLAGNRQTFASRGLNGPGTYDQLQRIVLIEAKNNQYPVIFFSRKNNDVARYPIISGIPECLSRDPHGDAQPYHYYFEKCGIRFHINPNYVATQFAGVRPGKSGEWQLSHEGLYDSFSGLIKSVGHFANEHLERISDKEKEYGRIQLCIIKPVVIFEGPIYECRITDGSYELKEVNRIHFYRSHHSNTLAASFTIDVVRESEFPSLMFEFHVDLKNYEAAIQKYIDETRMTKSAEQDAPSNGG